MSYIITNIDTDGIIENKEIREKILKMVEDDATIRTLNILDDTYEVEIIEKDKRDEEGNVIILVKFES